MGLATPATDWRGAAAASFLGFVDDFAAQTVKLETNYRSPQAIVQVADHKANEIAVLVRAWWLTRCFEERLLKGRIPYRNWSPK